MNFDFIKMNRILVRGVNWVGDTILTYPTVEALKRRFPDSEISILVPSHLADLWKTFPYIENIIPFENRKGIASFFEDFRISRLLRKERFDLGLILPRSFHSAFQLFLAKIPIRIGYQDEGRSLLLTHRVRRKKEFLRVHRVYYYQELLKPFGAKHPLSSPRLHLREEDRRWAEEILKGRGLPNGKPMIGLNPGAAYGLAKCWFPDRFGELGRRLSQTWKAKILVFGRVEERKIANRILSYLGGEGIDLTGQTNLLQLAALLEKCSLLVTNDTGTMHIASATGTPVIALFGPTDPKATGPWGERHVVIKKEVSCSPCFKRVCPTDHRCMEQITVEEVQEAVNGKLRGLK